MAASLFTPLSMTAQTAWQDLRRILMDADGARLRGTLTVRENNGNAYLYDRYRLGERVVERYLGPDEPSLRAQLEASRNEANAAGGAAARLVALLKAESLLTPDLATGQLLMAMARVGTFRLGGTLVGTHAFRSYEGVLGVHLGQDAVSTTQDIDIASFQRLSVALAEAGGGLDDEMGRTFSDLEFEPQLAYPDPHATWRWKQSKSQSLVEFLTPSFEEDEALRDLPALGVSAQSLHFLNYLIRDPIRVPVLYRRGVLVQVPRPERYAIHKLIVAERRRDGPEEGKSRKDRAQADLLIRHFAAEDPYALVDAYREAYETGPRWRQKIDACLKRLPEARAALDAALGEAGG